ncbi:hypothetical protein CLF_100065 [Clonorchis sinensis]|uniref:Uncharacterized protein n=1 Tax=Clonorchis sinensis TaxID=79923 RepID=G7Y2K6_CLOSI|nr:hypothetical protein CLF_100065 [Clonorchis sinensis]
MGFRPATLVLLKSSFLAVNPTGISYYKEVREMVFIRYIWNTLATGLAKYSKEIRQDSSTGKSKGWEYRQCRMTSPGTHLFVVMVAYTTADLDRKNTTGSATKLWDFFHCIKRRPVIVLLSEKVSNVAVTTVGNSHNESVPEGQYDTSDLIKSKM